MKALTAILRKNGKSLMAAEYFRYHISQEAHKECAKRYKELTGRLESYGFTVAYFGIRVNEGVMS